jgi:hypothetical protein
MLEEETMVDRLRVLCRLADPFPAAVRMRARPADGVARWEA